MGIQKLVFTQTGKQKHSSWAVTKTALQCCITNGILVNKILSHW